MAYGFKTEEELKEYLDNLGTEYRFSCFKENNQEGCHLLGDYLEAVKKDFETSSKVFKSNCDERNYAKSCFKFGTFSILGKGCESNNLLAFNYYKKACDLNYTDACLNAGVMLTSKENFPGNDTPSVELDFPTGLKYLEKACYGKSAIACYFASSLYLTGAEGIPKDKTKASQLSMAACDGGNIYACMNLCRMYKLGDGVEKDEEKANIYKKKAREIRDDMKQKRPIGLQQTA